MDFLTSGHSIPVWVTSLAFIATNLGAQEVIGMIASGAKYGMLTFNFYWMGAIPGMIILGVFMMPFYYGSRARSAPEYLKLRFDEKTRGFNAITFAVMTIFSSGISMYALGLLFQVVLGWSFTNSVLLSAAIVLVYTYLGGLTSAIYNEVLQFFLIVLGFLPLSVMAIVKAGGWSGVTARTTAFMAGQPGFANNPDVMTHTWKYIGHASSESDGRGVVRHGVRVGVGVGMQLLVLQLPGGAARYGCQFDGSLAIDAADRRISENADADRRGGAGYRRRCASSDERARHPGAEGRFVQLQSGADELDDGVLPLGSVGRGTDRAVCVVHVGDGGQRHGVQHGVHLRHLSELHQEARHRTRTTTRWRRSRPWSACCSPLARPTGRRDRTTSWTFCNWYSGL